MNHPPYWPDEADQAICHRFVLRGGASGSALCYLLGYYRHAGLSREAALIAVCKALQAQGVQP